MAKKSFMPADDAGKRAFLNTFAAELPLHAAAVGVTAAGDAAARRPDQIRHSRLH